MLLVLLVFYSRLIVVLMSHLGHGRLHGELCSFACSVFCQGVLKKLKLYLRSHLGKSMIKFKQERKELKPSLMQPKFLVCQYPPTLAAIASSMKVFGVKVAK